MQRHDTPWRDYLEEREEHVRRRESKTEVAIPMRDHTELAADLYLPPGFRRGPAVVQITPYDKRDAVECLHDAVLYQRNGFASLIVDCRGRGKSEGEWIPFVNDPSDGFDTIEWVAQQPWCDGNVGMTGLSYGGWTAWAAASGRPPHLKALISTSAAGRWQQEIPYMWGVFQLFFAWWAHGVRRRLVDGGRLEQPDWAQLLGAIPIEEIADTLDLGTSWHALVDHSTLDEFWARIRFDEIYESIDVPCLHVTGWYDMEDLTGAFHHFEHMLDESPAKGSQFLIVGPWSHIKSRFPDHAYGGVTFDEGSMDMDQIHVDWFDHWLRQPREEALDQEQVQLFETGSRRWVAANTWPIPSEQAVLFTAGDGSLSKSPPQAESHTPLRYDPEDPVPSRMQVGTYHVNEIPLDQTEIEARSDVVSFTSDPLSSALRVSGWPHVIIRAASSVDDTDWHVRIADVDPDGRSLKVTQGCLRASYRESLTDPSPLVPGKTYEFDIEMWPVTHVFQAGHRVRLLVMNSDFPWFARNLNSFESIAKQCTPIVAHHTIVHTPTMSTRVIFSAARGSAPS